MIEKQSFFLQTMARFIFDATSKGYVLTCGEFYRSPEICALYAKEGKGILHSNHTKRLAGDINAFYNGRLLNSKEEYYELGELWKSYSTNKYICAWGGDFQRIDADHFSIADGDIE